MRRCRGTDRRGSCPSSCTVADYWNKEVWVLGCGNVLFGDDGFGPGMVGYLREHFKIPDGVYLEDVGLSVREILFNAALAEKRPKLVVILDAMDRGRSPGDVFEVSIDELPEKKTDDFCMHTMASPNMLKDLAESGVEVRILACQVESIPEEVAPGLSPAVAAAMPAMCDLLTELVPSVGGDRD